MADQVQPFLCGIDVSLHTLDIAQSDGVLLKVPNEEAAIIEWLAGLPNPAHIAVEATNDYHEAVLERAMSAGHQVYLVNAKQVHHYREAVGPRAKTDADDAQLLLRYLSHERSQLTPCKSLNVREKRLWRLLKRRAGLVKARTQLQQSLRSDPDTRELCEQVVVSINTAIKRIESLMKALARELGWGLAVLQCQSIPGIGELNALALVSAFQRGHFRNSDQFVAYLGLDVRVRDSGRYRGRRKLSKRGDAEMRRLLYNGAMSFARNPDYKPLYERLRARGFSSTAAYVVLARKLVRIAFALLSRGEVFDSERFKSACMGT